MAINTNEVTVEKSSPAPSGYSFGTSSPPTFIVVGRNNTSLLTPRDFIVRKGDVYMTKNCREKTHAAGRVLYVVVDKKKKKKAVGLRCPSEILQAVTADHRATIGTRAAAVDKRDAAIADEFQTALVKEFPDMPKDQIPVLLKQTLAKRQRRVGRTSTKNLTERVRLAVYAHARHCHTNYDQLLRDGVAREDARKRIFAKVRGVVKHWRGQRKLQRSVAASRGGAAGAKKAGARTGNKRISMTKSASRGPKTSRKTSRKSISTFNAPERAVQDERFAAVGPRKADKRKDSEASITSRRSSRRTQVPRRYGDVQFDKSDVSLEKLDDDGKDAASESAGGMFEDDDDSDFIVPDDLWDEDSDWTPDM